MGQAGLTQSVRRQRFFVDLCMKVGNWAGMTRRQTNPGPGYRLTEKSAARQRQVEHWTEKSRTRFWRQVRKTSGCWFFAYRNEQGYGHFSLKGSAYVAHRVSLLWATGNYKTKKVACHTCPNKNCVKPAHLYWGTPKTNTEDTIRDYEIECAHRNFLGCTQKEQDDIILHMMIEDRGRFWKNTIKTNSCWIFGKQKSKVPRFWTGQIMVPAHRVTLLWAKGYPPSDAHYAVRSCKNTMCVNPEHVVWQTRQSLYLQRKTPWSEGVKSHYAKVNEDMVRAMRALYAKGMHTHRQIGEIYGLSESGAGHILRGHTWKHVF